MREHQFEAAEIVAADPNVASVAGMIQGGNQGRLFIELKPREERELNADEIIEALRPQLAQVPGFRVFLQNPPLIRIGGQNTRSLYQLTLQNPDTRELYEVAPKFEERLRQIPGLQDVTSDLQIKSPQINVTFDRDRIAQLGLSVDAVQAALSNAYGTRQVSTIFAPTNQYAVVMQVAPEFQQSRAALSMLHLRGRGEQLVPLSAVATSEQSLAQCSEHFGNCRRHASVNRGPCRSADAVAAVRRPSLSRFDTFLPASKARHSLQSSAGPWPRAADGDCVIYIVLGILSESFSPPSRSVRLPSAASAPSHAPHLQAPDIYASSHHLLSAC